MARKLKKSAMSGLKEKFVANEQASVEKERQATQMFERGKQLMGIGQVADAITVFENMLALKVRISEQQANETREMLRYFIERSMKRMTGYPNILRFMGVN